MNAREAADLLLRDKVFFENGGGVTLSGGECLMQWAFSAEVLWICAQAGVDTAIETSLYAPREAIDALLPVTDHFLIDIKYLDADTHQKILGRDNRLILDHYRYLLSKGADVLVRTPLIPSYTASDDNIRSIARFIREQDPDARYELLNYNPLCRGKYEALELDYPVDDITPLSSRQMEHFYDILRQEGIRHIVKE